MNYSISLKNKKTNENSTSAFIGGFMPAINIPVV